MAIHAINVTGSAASTGSFGRLHLGDGPFSYGDAIIHARTNISTNGINDAYIVAETAGGGDSEAGFIVKNTNGTQFIGYMYNNSGDAYYGPSGQPKFTIQGSTGHILLAANQNISGSSTTTGSFGQVYVDKAVAVDSITFNTPHIPSTGSLAPMIEADSGNTSNAHLRFYTSEGSRTEKMVIRYNGMVGIGETSPLGKLHVKTGETDASPHSGADELVLEGTGDMGMSFLSATGGAGVINFGDSGDNNIGNIEYQHATNEMRFTTNNGRSLTLDSSQNATFGGNVSGSATSTGSFGSVHAADAIGIGTLNTGVYALSVIKPDGNNGLWAAYIQNADSTSGESNGLEINAGSNASDTPFVIKTHDSGTELFRVLGSGNVGIGTSAPETKLVVKRKNEVGKFTAVLRGGSDALTASNDWFGLGLGYGGHDSLYINAGILGLWRSTSGATDLLFCTRNGGSTNVTNADARMTILSTGNVGINDASPTYQLDVNGTFRTTGAATFDGSVTATTFTGNVTGNAGTVTISSDFSGTYPVLVDVGSNAIYNNPSLTYNGTSDTLTSPNFAGALTGNVTGNTSGTAATVTTAAQPAITSVGTLTSFRSTGIDDNADALAITIDSSERVGIGTTSPTAPLHVVGTIFGDDTLHISASGGFTSVGIGTTSPSARLHIVQKTSGPSIKLEAKNYGGKVAVFGYDSVGAYIITGTSGTPIIYLQHDGNTSIGSSATSTETLTVQGNLYVTGSIRTDGDITAQNYIVSSSVTHMTQSFSSGSTIFGDTVSDTHKFTGSLSVTGSGTFAGNVLAPRFAVDGTNSIGLAMQADNVSLAVGAGTDFRLYHDGNTQLWNYVGGGSLRFGTNNTLALTLDASQNATFGGNVILPSTGVLYIGSHTLKEYGGDLTIESAGDDINFVGSWIRIKSTDGGGVNSGFRPTGELTLGADAQNTYMLKVASGNAYFAGNATFAGTIGSGAITSTAGIAGTTGTFSSTVAATGITLDGVDNPKIRGVDASDGWIDLEFRADANDLYIASSNGVGRANIFAYGANFTAGISATTGTFGGGLASTGVDITTDGHIKMAGKLYIGSNQNVNIFTSDSYNRNLEFNMYDSNATAYRTVLFLDGVTAGSGRVGIGQTSPSYNLDVTGTLRATGNATFGGTIGSGAITSTAGIAGTTGTFSGAISATTLDTGQGANELYDMNQNVKTTDSVTFNAATISDNLTMIGGQFYVGGTGDGAFRMYKSGTSLLIGRRASGTWADNRMTLSADGNVVFAGTLNSGAITSTGNISGSSTSTGSFGHGYIDGKLGIGTTSPETLLTLDGGASGYPGIVGKTANYTLYRLEQYYGDEGYLALYYQGTEKIRIRAKTGEHSYFNGGNLGIGDTSPSYKLDIDGDLRSTGNANFNAIVYTDKLRPTGTSGMALYNSQGNIVSYLAPRGTGAAATGIQITDNYNMMFGTDKDYSIAYRSSDDKLIISDGVDFATPRITLDSSGNVGIGTTSPPHALTVVGQISSSSDISAKNGGALLAEQASATNPTFIPDYLSGDSDTGIGSSGANQLSLITGGVNALSINSSQNATFGGNITAVDGTFTGDVTFGDANIDRRGFGSGGLSSNALNYFTGTMGHSWTGGDGFGTWFNTASTPNADRSGNIVRISGAITEVSSGTAHPWFTGLRVEAPTITTAGGSVTNSATVYISGPMANATTNYSLYVASGNSYFAGSLSSGDITITKASGDPILSLTPTVSDGNTYIDQNVTGGGDAYIRWNGDSNSDLMFIKSVGNHTPSLTIDGVTGDATFAGTINSGAITSTAGIAGTTGTFSGAVTGSTGTFSGNLLSHDTIVAHGNLNGGLASGRPLYIEVNNGNEAYLGIRQADQIYWSIGLEASDTNLYFRSGNVGSDVARLTLTTAGNATFGGTINSGAITSTAGISGTTGTLSSNLTVNGTGEQKLGTHKFSYGTIANFDGDEFFHAFKVTGGQLNSVIKLTLKGVSSSSHLHSHVIDIQVNHYQDIQVKSWSGNYSQIIVKVLSDGNENFDVELKATGMGSYTHNMTLEMNVQTLTSDTNVAFGGSSSYSTVTHTHTTKVGTVMTGQDGTTNTGYAKFEIDGTAIIGGTISSGAITSTAGIAGTTGTFSGQILGAASGVSYSFTGDPDTGIQSGGTNTLQITTGGSKALDFDGNQLATFTGNVSLDKADGTFYLKNGSGTVRAYLQYQESPNDLIISANEAGSGIKFLPSGDTALTLASDKTATFAGKITMNATHATTNSSGLHLKSTASHNWYLHPNSSGNLEINYNDQNEAVTFDAAGFATFAGTIYANGGDGTLAGDGNNIGGYNDIAIGSQVSGKGSRIQLNSGHSTGEFVIQARSSTGYSDGNIGIYRRSGVGAYSTIMQIGGDGKIGIGTETPQEKLTVAGNISSSGDFKNVTNDGAVSSSAFYLMDSTYIGAPQRSFKIVNSNPYTMEISTNATTPVAVMNLYGASAGSAKVGINGTAGAEPSYTLDVNGTGRFTGDLRLDTKLLFGGAYDIDLVSQTLTMNYQDDSVYTKIRGFDGGCQLLVGEDTVSVTGASIVGITGTYGAPAFQLGSANDGFYHGASSTTQTDAGINVLVNNVQEFLFKDGGDFHADGDVVAYSSTIDSDYRLKTNITNISSSLDKVKKLRPVEFDWLVDRDNHEYGLIAQEVEEVLPMLVSEHNAIGDTKKFLKELDGTEVSKTVDYSKLTVLLVDAMKEQQNQIEELKTEIQEIKNGLSQ